MYHRLTMARIGLGELLVIGLVVAIACAGCKSKAGATCRLQSDCAGDLVCFCAAWGPYECKEPTRCTAPSEADAICAKEDSCAKDGECVAPRRAEMEGNSIAMCTATAEGCPRWEVCRKEGKCAMERGLCVARTDDDCRKSETCAKRGGCKRDHDVCLPGSDSDCAASEVCRTEGKCKIGPYGICD